MNNAFDENGEEHIIYFYEYTWDPSIDILPDFVPNEMVDEREWTSCFDNPEFRDSLLECAAHYVQRTWKYRLRR